MKPTTPPTGPYDLTARLIGPFEVCVAGAPVVHWRSQKAASVLKFLLLRELRPVRREVLIDAFWPYSSPKAGRGNLNVAVYALRSVLRAVDPERTYVTFHDGCYQLHPSLRCWVDLRVHAAGASDGRDRLDSGDFLGARDAFERARSLCRGQVFEGDASGVWSEHERLRFDEVHRAVLEGLALAHLELGDPVAAVDVLHDLLEGDPCRETGHQLLMRAYAAQHQRQLVVRQYRRCVDALRRELSVEPAASTQALLRRLIGGA